jgi:hypothetical protein
MLNLMPSVTNNMGPIFGTGTVNSAGLHVGQ